MNLDWSKGPWAWEHRATDDGKHVATLLVTKHRPVPCNDPVIFALREDWMGKLCKEREEAKQMIKSVPDLIEALRTIGNQSIGSDWTAEQALAFIKQLARDTVKNATTVA